MSEQWPNTGSAWPSNNAPSEVEVQAPAELQLTQEQKNKLITDWMGDKATSVLAIENERKSRDTLRAAIFPNPKKGTQRYVSPEGYGSIKLVWGWNYTLGDKELIDPATGGKVSIREQVDTMLDKIEQLGERGKFLAERLVRWSPELSASEYEALGNSGDPTDLQAKALIDELLTVKEKAPSMEFEPPKKDQR